MNINELEELAKTATPGPWWSGECNPPDGHALAWIGKHFVDCDGGQRNYLEQEDDAKYIAAANPTAILELIAAYREAVAEMKLCSCDEYFEGHIDKALATAKRLGVE